MGPAEHPAHGSARLPDFFVVGHPKCGTTALYRTLRDHPEIYMPSVKEPTFFADELPKGNWYQSAPTTWEGYLALFVGATDGQRAGESSPHYLWSTTAAKRIAEVRPDAKIIAILREPADFLRSLHLQFVQGSWEIEKDFRKALQLESRRMGGAPISPFCPSPELLLYSSYVCYVEQLDRYRRQFQSDNVLVIVYDDFRADNEATVRRILRFLEVDDTVPLTVAEANPTVSVRFGRLYNLLYTVATGEGRLGGAAKRGIELVTPADGRQRAAKAVRQRLLSAPPEADAELMEELRRRFRREVEALSSYLGRDLVELWGYDRGR